MPYPKTKISKEELERLYLVEKLSMQKIADKFGVTSATILFRLREYEIPPRTYSEALKGRKPWNTGRKLPSWIKTKIGHASKRMWKERREELLKSRAMRYLRHDPVFQKKMLEALLSESTRLKRSKNMKERWKNPIWKSKIIEASLKGLIKRPTSLEKQFIDIIDKHNLPYKYVGNGSVLIGWKNPDFININGKKICIEVANKYHHNKLWAIRRIKHYARWGWRCLVFWQDSKTRKVEDDENTILEKIESTELDSE